VGAAARIAGDARAICEAVQGLVAIEKTAPDLAGASDVVADGVDVDPLLADRRGHEPSNAWGCPRCRRR
jgi:hypothetical protein